ncbi:MULTISPECIES: hypothetical protein [unclassified Agrococcus]|uniref:hypothetical protein n=1 Tax=unclassified Agrococcus TaxID=2615065 RepID=UPI00360D024E
MTAYRGLTWDHPRGRVALEAAAQAFSARGVDTLAWDVHPLEGFESAPIAETAARYDLVVLDHPHLGDALEADCLVAVDESFGADDVARWREAAIGRSLESYVVDGRLWALPLDAATQVSARRAESVPEAPVDWDAVRSLARAGGVAPNLAGPHAFLSLCSIAVSAGADPTADGRIRDDAWDLAIDVLADLAAHAPVGTVDENPIALLERMSTGDDLRYVPLVYGYVSYAQRPAAQRVAFGAPPAVDGRIGSTLGGTGIAITRRTPASAELLDHVAWLMGDEAQRSFIPAHAGQPSARSAWRDQAVDAAAGGFYSGTAATTEQAWVRPRFPGYVAVQTAASALVRDAALGRVASREAHERVDDLLRTPRTTGAAA